MNDQDFERSLKKLKETYNQRLNQSSPDEIMNYIKHKEKRKVPFFTRIRGLGVAVSIVAVIGIGSILLLSEGTENNANHDLDPMEFSGAETINVEDIATIFQREEKMTDTLLIEGQEEEIELTLWADEELWFSTYIDARFQVDNVEDENGYTALVFANYMGGQVEPPFFTVHKASADRQIPLEQYLERLKEEYERQGFLESEEILNSKWNADGALFISKQEQNMAKAVYLFEIRGEIYEITETTFGEYSEGLDGRLQLMQQHLQWH
ncbi:hypothetical protein [Alkalihalobacterium chitinilyticum]|uniref:DUF4367 domain-containing protein n=1 Tax=Alkalihalobacterium chitinilyticum TaxID=2980103 RepID=A0ABT5V921_9BACI|nr:hypothetical protein [Alkalihalobacterium chitinilyticum]MDE5411968.1 hypothetical protein [Alkalihalobacterium chitinilyticum]